MIHEKFPIRKLMRRKSLRLRIAAGSSAGSESRSSGTTTRRLVEFIAMIFVSLSPPHKVVKSGLCLKENTGRQR
jgi:hypothetical protein